MSTHEQPKATERKSNAICNSSSSTSTCSSRSHCLSCSRSRSRSFLLQFSLLFFLLFSFLFLVLLLLLLFFFSFIIILFVFYCFRFWRKYYLVSFSYASCVHVLFKIVCIYLPSCLDCDVMFPKIFLVLICPWQHWPQESHFTILFCSTMFTFCRYLGLLDSLTPLQTIDKARLQVIKTWWYLNR